MSQFDIFTIDTKIKENSKKIQTLKNTLTKIKQNEKQIEVRAVEHVNKVAMFTVMIPHTSEYLMKLGCEYFAKVKTKTAVQILEGRIKYNQQQNGKWTQLKNNLIKQSAATEKAYNNQYGTSMEAIGENQEGEQIFNILQFEESQNNKNKVDKLTTIKQKENDDESQEVSQSNKEKKISTQVHNIEKKVQQQKIQNAILKQCKEMQQQRKEEKVQIERLVEEKPKKISKFKAQRMQHKQK